jgi:hypothetical protein
LLNNDWVVSVKMTGLTRWRTLRRLSLRQSGTLLSKLFFIFALVERKNEKQEEQGSTLLPQAKTRWKG